MRCVLKRLKIYDNEAESVLMSAISYAKSDDSSAFDSDAEKFPPKLILQNDGNKIPIAEEINQTLINYHFLTKYM
eukprot:12781735-Ditylum_brightwellii.AAC.1